MWSDNESSVDLLRYSYLVSAVKRLVLDPALRPVTVGVYGDWGSGKSTVIQHVQKQLEGDEKLIVLSFNGWLFEGYDDAKSVLMGTILDELEEKLKKNTTVYEKVKGRLASLLRRVNVMHTAGAAVKYGVPLLMGMPYLSLLGVGADLAKKVGDAVGGTDVDDVGKLVKDVPSPEQVRKTVREFRSDFEKLLADAEIDALVIFIDDLDRCLPDTIIETLEAIKLFLFVPRTAFVIGADERLIQYAVRKNFPELPGAEAEVGRDYLEKLIQVPVHIPPLSSTEIESYMNLLFAQKHLSPATFQKACDSVASFTSKDIAAGSFTASRCREVAKEVSKELEEALDLTMQTAAVLAPGLSGSPRRTKRFLNTLLLRLTMAEDRGLDIKRRVLAKLMLLEYIRPVFFRQLAQWQAVQDGHPTEISEGETRAREEPAGTGAASKPSKPGAKRSAAPVALETGTVSDRVVPWLADPWMRKWLRDEPALADVDLRPYFFVAHARVGNVEQSSARLSPVAREVLVQLLDPGKPVQQQGLKMVDGLSDADATAVFESLTERLRPAEDDEARHLESTLLDLAERRPALLPQTIAVFQELPLPRVVPAMAIKLAGVARKDGSGAAARPLLEAWSNADGALGTAAKQALERLTKKD
ncbi:MAG: P-loop NTPase fold protein [Acidobacteriota bacterium]